MIKMEYINNQIYHKYCLIDFIIDTNKQTEDHDFYSRKEILVSWLMNINKSLFLKAIVLINFNSYSGYFALDEREKIKSCLVNMERNNFEKIIEHFNSEFLENEILAHNLWLARLIINGAKYQNKYLIQAYRDCKLEDKIINFKNKININNRTFDLCTILLNLCRNKIKIKDYEKSWIEENYKKEIKIVKNYLECEIEREMIK